MCSARDDGSWPRSAGAIRPTVVAAARTFVKRFNASFLKNLPPPPLYFVTCVCRCCDAFRGMSFYFWLCVLGFFYSCSFIRHKSISHGEYHFVAVLVDFIAIEIFLKICRPRLYLLTNNRNPLAIWIFLINLEPLDKINYKSVKKKFSSIDFQFRLDLFSSKTYFNR